MYYREWCLYPQRRKGVMVSEDRINKIVSTLADTGYCSVYAFKEEDAQEVKASGSSKYLDRYEVHADCLIIDIDNGEEGLDKVRDRLVELNLRHIVYKSGGKGFHVYIPHQPVLSRDLPYSHKKAIQNMGIECDLSLYQHGRIISLPGRVHPKTKQKKELLYIIPGEKYNLELVEAPARPIYDAIEGDLSDLSSAIFLIQNTLSNPPTEGGRHLTLWRIAKDLCKAGLEYTTAVDLLINLNSNWDNPKSDEEVERAVEGAWTHSQKPLSKG